MSASITVVPVTFPWASQHQPARLDAHRFGLEGREVTCNFISIYELAAGQQTGQQGEGGGGFACAVASGQEVEGIYPKTR